jgi:phosphoglycolate phosphatase-like HAD superfamily hydrolase
MNLHRKVPKLSGAFAAVMLCAALLTIHAYANAQTSPLASWNDGPTKQAIMSFVREVTDKSGTNYVPPEDRIATFDQDGTLWVEHPLYAQAMFALTRVHELAPQHPEWKQHEPFKAVLTNDREAMAKFSESDWEVILAATHTGMTTEAFQALVKQWLATAKDPRFHQPYTELVYQPMLEVMDYLRANGFNTYIVTGGGSEFVRVYSQHVYGVPPVQVLGSSILTKYEYRDGKPVLPALAEAVLRRRRSRQGSRDQTCSSASGPTARSAIRKAIGRC